MRENSASQLSRLAAASALALMLTACTDQGVFDVGAPEPEKAASEQRTIDPALNSLDGVTQHG